MVIIKCSTLEDHACFTGDTHTAISHLDYQKELDMKEGVSRKFVSLAPETYVILREGVCPTQINFLKKCVY